MARATGLPPLEGKGAKSGGRGAEIILGSVASRDYRALCDPTPFHCKVNMSIPKSHLSFVSMDYSCHGNHDHI